MHFLILTGLYWDSIFLPGICLKHGGKIIILFTFTLSFSLFLSSSSLGLEASRDIIGAGRFEVPDTFLSCKEERNILSLEH